jgi:type IV pilus assembly protein PilV
MTRRTTRGFTLLEVLIALLIFSLGLLGMAGLLTVSVKTNHSAYLRTQAFLLAQDMADRMRANAAGLWANAYTLNTITTPPSTPGLASYVASTACTTGTCTPAQVAARDLQLWQNQLTQFLPNAGVALQCTAAGVTANPKAPYPQTCEIQLSWTQMPIQDETTNPDIFDWVFQP